MKPLIMWIMFFSVFFFSCSESSTEPETDLTSSITPSEQTVGLDIEATFSVEIENIADLFAFSCEIVFDSTLVTLPENPLTIGSFWSADYISTSISDNDRLNIAIGLEQSSGIDGLSGNGVLFDFRVKGIQFGSSSLTFENITLINDEGEPVDGFDNITLSDGLIIIQ
ncbi:MAG: cohesin domain-containing protein [Candidatus Tenebribacter burtonii]|nr:cohesin domain-containing protein [Candidatus Tenebribacter burtonii]